MQQLEQLVLPCQQPTLGLLSAVFVAAMDTAQ